MIGFVVIGLCALQFSFVAGIEFTFDDAEVEFVDTEYFDPDNTEIYVQENDEMITVMVSKLTTIKQLPGDTVAHLKLMGLSMGVYKVPTALDVSMKICDLVDEPVVMGPLVKAFGFEKGNCPPPPGTYAQDGYIPPMDLMPPTFPENRYQGRFSMLVNDKAVFIATVDINVLV